MSISIKNLSFFYKNNDGFKIDNISCEIKKSSINVLLGLNGCGKTTLIKLLSGLLGSKNCSIQYDGKDLSSMNIYERSKVFSYVSQKQSTTADFLVKDYLLCGFINSLSFLQRPKEEQIGKMKNTAEMMGISHLLLKKLGEISGGEYQLVSIVSAVLQDTPYIILDEPMSALDIKNQASVINMLKSIAEKGKTIILSTHNPNHALKLNANVILMKEGKILKTGEAEKIVTIENLEEIYGDQICLSTDLSYNEISIK